MPGPRKVRIYQDVKKSPNWYVEWRDLQGRKHCESCGPRREDAEVRGQQIAEQLRLSRNASSIPICITPHRDTIKNQAETGQIASIVVPKTIDIPLLLKVGEIEVPMTINLKVTQEVMRALQRLVLADPSSELIE